MNFSKKEEEQISKLFEANLDLRKQQNQKLTRKNNELTTALDNKRKEVVELRQENMFTQQTIPVQKKKIEKKFLAIIITTVIVFGTYSFMFTEPTGIEYEIDGEPKLSGHTIQNLKGDTIETYLSWKKIGEQNITVNILNGDRLDPKIVSAITEVIESEEVIEVDNSLLHKGPKGTKSIMYEGWKGAMNEASKTQTKNYIPVDFDIVKSNNGEGDIVIELTNKVNGDGFSGWTNIIADESQNQILKAKITVFGLDKISIQDVKTIVRHEMGHAMGLVHSTDPDDLMFPTIETNFPYISECAVDSIISLYDEQYGKDIVCDI